MADSPQTTRFRFWRWLIRFIGVTVPRRFRARFRQEWEAEIEYREELLARWDRLDWRNKLELLWRSSGAFWDALWLQRQRWEDDMIQDLRFGVRMLWKNPGFTLVAVLTLSLGIGANSSIFSVVNAVLLRPLPFREPERLIWFWGVQPQLSQGMHAPADFLDFQAQNSSFEQLAAFRNLSFTLTGDGQPERIDGRIVSANYFALLGVSASRGRCFAPEDGRAGSARAALLSYGFWQRRFGGMPQVIGRTLTLNGDSATVIGIMPPDFKETDVELWLNPYQVVPDLATGSRENIASMRNQNYLRIIGRLKPGVELPQAQADINAITARLRQ